MKKQLVVLQFIALIVVIILMPTPLLAEVIRNGGDNGNLNEVDQPGDVIIFI